MPDAGALAPYDVVLLGSFGGPEAPEEVVPFLRRVTAGRGIPDERLAEVGEHYVARGGRSPINDLNRDLLARLRAELDRRGIDVPLVWGNRNSEPFFADALHEALDLGATRVVTLLTSAYSSYSSCRQYREDLAAALDEVGPAADGLVVDKVRPVCGAPRPRPRVAAGARRRGRCPAGPDAERAASSTSPTRSPRRWTTRRAPVTARATSTSTSTCGWPGASPTSSTPSSACDLEGELVFCSRSGPPTQPWLEPDVNDRLEELAAEGGATVVCAPIGFVSDHMEVVHDLDTEAAETAARVGVPFVRVATAGTDEHFVEGLVDLLLERAAEARGEVVVPESWLPGDVRPSVCAPGCCPNLRTAKPALCGRD